VTVIHRFALDKDAVLRWLRIRAESKEGDEVGALALFRSIKVNRFNALNATKGIVRETLNRFASQQMILQDDVKLRCVSNFACSLCIESIPGLGAQPAPCDSDRFL
jgi:hypothetical protein